MVIDDIDTKFFNLFEKFFVVNMVVRMVFWKKLKIFLMGGNCVKKFLMYVCLLKFVINLVLVLVVYLR